MLQLKQKINTLLYICAFLIINIFIFNIFSLSAQVFPFNNLIYDPFTITLLIASGSYNPFSSPFSLYTDDPYSSYDPSYSDSTTGISPFPFSSQNILNLGNILNTNATYVYNPVSVLNTENPFNVLASLGFLNPIPLLSFGAFNYLPAFY